ncbi:hypothetical protein SUNI508_00056 [Seiridium unicorne]|uniref:PH domain-containing protein n=1 Tax=Seiridium unicorne TaxID=138068 RepID=A0ABR2VHZ4_9PEZI
MSRPEEPLDGAAPQPVKFSRYRSVRGKSASTVSSAAANNGGTARNAPRTQTGEPNSMSAPDPAPANSIARSMSRYRRHGASVSVDSDATPKITAPHQREQPPMPPVPVIPSTLKTSSHDESKIAFPNDKDGFVPLQNPSHSASSRPDRYVRHTESTTTDQSRNRKVRDRPSRPSDEGERRRMADRSNRERRKQQEELDAANNADQIARKERESDRILAKQKKKSLEALQVSLANKSQQSGFRSPKARSPVVEKFVALTRRRKSKEGLSPTSSTGGSVTGSVDFGYSQTELPEVPKLPVGIEVGGKGIVPQKDAPVSAVNHGDRIVSVRCRHHTFILPVTPDTTSVDIVLATAKNMTYDLEWSPQDCVVLEAYGPLGLERRIRKFEQIRDVMNSWDRDTHNQLVVSASEDPRQDRDLEADSILDGETAPQGIQVYMYHSNRPGKWNKRWITLTDQGQILSAKKPDAGSSDKDALSLCHLSDYDIYTPTESQMRRRLKPPKKYCFAVKSQHKPAMFMDTENYVQYFSTEDPRTATQFSGKVQGWRSWYLWDRKPAARRISIPKTDDKPPRLPSVRHASKKSVNAAPEGVHEASYTVGEFEPLIDMRRFDKRLSLFGQDIIPSEPDPSTMPKKTPAHLKKGSKDSKSDGALIDKIKSTNAEAFTGNGLLGQGYDARKGSIDKGASNPRRFSKDFGDFGGAAFTNGPSLLNQQAETDAGQGGDISWFPSALEHSAKHRDTDNPRPNTSAGVVSTRPSHSRSRSHSRPPPIPQQSRLRSDRPPISNPHLPGSHDPNSPDGSVPLASRRQPPKPLVNLTTPIVNEPPQWSKKGHGVQAPEGMHHLIDFISIGPSKDKPSGLLEVPPRSSMRRSPPNTAPLPDAPYNTSPTHRSGGGLSRTRSKSSGAPPSRPLINDVPPVPTLPGNGGRTMTMGEKERVKMDAMREAMKAREREFKDRERGRARERDREREPRSEYNSTGRVGTLKVV